MLELSEAIDELLQATLAAGRSTRTVRDYGEEAGALQLGRGFVQIGATGPAKTTM